MSNLQIDSSSHIDRSSYIDNHFHGGGGISNDTVADLYIGNKSEGLKALETVLAPHKKSGTTHHTLSLVTAEKSTLLGRTAALSQIAKSRDDILGVHLEACFLSPLHKGAHDETLLISPDISFLKELISAGDGEIAQITLAPELDGGLEAVEYIRSENIVPSIGHTDADYKTAFSSLEAGACNFTHLFNTMRQIQHRAPGPVMAARDWYKAGNSLTVEIINDGFHIDPIIVKLAFDLFSDFQTGETAVALVTDAMEAAGMDDGNYKIGNLPVVVKGGLAKIQGTDTIAGSTLTLGQAEKNALDLQIDKRFIKNSLAKKILIR
jgi:N-acetylglucosamine-6-phosphate deacetylase